MIICILQKGTMGTLLYLNSQEEQIISDHTAHIDHIQLKPGQGTMLLFASALWGTAPVVVSAKYSDFHNIHHGCAGMDPSGSHTNSQDRAGCTCSLSKLLETGAGGAQCLPISELTARSSAQTRNICTRLKLFIPVTFGGWVRFIAKVKLSSS